MSITNEKITENRERFLSILIEALQHRDFDTSKIIPYFDSTDFFVAPASTKYHNAFKGGLCEHCLNVYDNLKLLVTMKGLDTVISDDSIAISALLHDMGKVNFYETYSKNVKTYCEDGDKWDNGGKFKWETVTAYKVREPGDRFIYGNHEETSEFIARSIALLTVEESMAILRHHAGMSFDSTPEGISDIYNANKLACLLHLADTVATFCDESTLNE